MSGKSKAEALEVIAAARWRVAAVLTALTLVTYFGFILLIAFNKPMMGQQLVPGLSLGILLGALMIVFAWILTGVYMRWANQTYDKALDPLRR